MVRFFTIFAILFCTSQLCGQQYNFTRYSIEEGLPRASVYAVYEDTEGFLWIGVDGGGACVFDGHEFITYDNNDGLASNTIRTIFQDHAGNMWFGTQGRGASKFDGKNFTTYDIHDGLSNNIVRAISQDEQGNIWFGTLGGGICLLNTQTEEVTIYDTKNGLLNNNVRILHYDKSGNMWIGTDGGLTVYDGETFSTYTTDQGLPHNKIHDIFEDRDGNFWIGTQNGLVYTSNFETFTTFTTEDGLVHNRIKAISQDFQGRIWLGTLEGVNMLDRFGFHTFTEDEGLSNSRIRDIICDGGGNIWFGTYFSGVNKYAGDAFTHFKKSEGLINDQILSIYEDNRGDILLGTFDGVSKLKFDDLEKLSDVINVTSDDGLCNNVVNVVYKDWSGYYWYGTDWGVSITEKSGMNCITTTEGLVDDQVFSVLQSDSNEFWVGTFSGVSRIIFTDGREEYTIQNYTLKDGLGGEEVSSMLLDRFGNVWFGFKEGGVGIYKNDEFLLPHQPRELDEIISLREDEFGYVWIATAEKGLFRYKNENKLYGDMLFEQTDIHEQFVSHSINSILFDYSGNLWIGTTKGINKVMFDEMGNYVSVQHYGKEEGFSGIETTRNASCIDEKGNIWFGTINGATMYNPNYDIKNEIEPCTHITQIKLFFEKIDWDNSEYADTSLTRFHIPQNLILPHAANHITFEFTGVSLTIPSKVRYKWQLVGVDEHPTTAKSISQVSYTNLDAGDYVFKVWASNNDGVWNEQPATFEFTVLPPFWQTWWFIALMIALGVGAFQLVSQLRNGRLKKAKQRLEKEVKLRTQEIFEQKQQLEHAFVQLDEKTTSITDSINYAKRIQSAIMRPADESNSKLVDRMFILYKPKDIVSGDFYWFMDAAGKTFVTAADCTGHGVPGAFMSMIGITYLNEIVGKKGIYEPAEILHELRKSVIDALHVEGRETKDGMDISFSCIDWKNMKLEWAGALNPLYLIRNGELTETKGDKMPVGKHDMDRELFTNHVIDLQQGDVLYMFSDGYPDQFGGETNKKFMTKNFKRLLLSIYQEDLKTQKQMLRENLASWQGKHEQIDDILVMGIRI